jgi:hypothetical protein
MLITGAGVAPDLDGLGALVELATRDRENPLLWFTEYHHVIHTALFGAVLFAVSLLLARRRWITSLLVLASFHLHLLGDLVGARGPDGYSWPILYLLPFSDAVKLEWSGQWGLNAWPNFLITGLALAATLYLAWRRGFSPVGLFSARADLAFVETLRRRFPPKAARAGAPKGAAEGARS